MEFKIDELSEKILRENDSKNLEIFYNNWNLLKLKYQNLTNCVAVCDFAAMNWKPKMLRESIAILISEISEEPFRDQILLFQPTLQWYSLKNKTLKQKINDIYWDANNDCNNSVDFCNIYEKILQKLIDNNSPKEKVPKNIVILTNKCCEAANKGQRNINQEKLNNMKERFFKEGGWALPTIIVWNFEPNINTINGLIQYTGWDSSILKSL
jgi:hypothetical protein